MGPLLAHSAQNNFPAQTYEAHICGVSEKASQYAAEAERYAVKSPGVLTAVVQKSAPLHDLGKLDEQNQSVLHRSDSGQLHLPINHVDAGSAALIAEGSLYAALMVYSHHRGLPDLETEFQREEAILKG